jgi:hypothetical protein
MSKGEKTQRGRKPENLWDKYKVGEILAEVQLWYSEGATDDIVAKKLNIGLTTLYKIKNKYPEFKENLKRGKDTADEQVESALFRRALGYEIEETTQEIKVNADGTAQPAIIRKTKKKVPPDVTAQIFWLKNRRPNEWRDKKEIGRPPTIKDFDLEVISPELRARLEEELFQDRDSD